MTTAKNAGLATYGRPADTEYFSVALASDVTSIPTSATDELEECFEWVKISSDGLTEKPDLGKGDPLKDWTGKSQIDSPSNPSAQLTAPILSQTRAGLQLFYGADNVEADETTGKPTSWGFDGSTDEYVIVTDELWNDENGKPADLVRTVYPRAVPQELGDVSHTREDGIVREVTFDLLAGEDGRYYNSYRASSASKARSKAKAAKAAKQ